MADSGTQDLRVSARQARLTAAAADDGPPWHFGGVAVKAGDVLTKPDGTRVKFTAEELRKAARTLEGEAITKDHPTDSNGQPIYPVPFDEKYGEVERAGWLEAEQAVGYQASTHDERAKESVEAGHAEVSIHPRFNEEPYAGADADTKAVDIVFLDLSLVSDGESPNNSAQWGTNQALAAWTESADLEAELTARLTADTTDADDEELLARLSALERALGDVREGLTAAAEEKLELVDELIAESEKYDEEQRAELLASPTKLLENVLEYHLEDDEPQASQLPATGVLSSIGPPNPGPDDEDDVALGLADHTPEELQAAADDLEGVATGTADLPPEERETMLTAGGRFKCPDCGEAGFRHRTELRVHRKEDCYAQ